MESKDIWKIDSEGIKVGGNKSEYKQYSSAEMYKRFSNHYISI